MLNLYIAMSHRLASFLWLLVPALFSGLALSQTPAVPARLKNSPALAIIDAGGWKSIQKGMDFRKISLERTEPFQVIDLKLVRFDTAAIVPQIVRSAQFNFKGSNVKTLADRSGAIAMINANYFDEKGRPLGFLKAGAEEINASVSKSSLFTGIFGIKNLLPFIVHRDDFLSQQADEGLQAGPLLMTRGAALSVTRGAGRQSRRSLVGIDKEQRLIIAVTDSLLGGLSWVELQELFSAAHWQIEVTELLNLDGGGSAQLYVKGIQLEELVPGTSDVPVAIGFFPK